MANVISVLKANYESFYLLHNIQTPQVHSEVGLVNLRLITNDRKAGLVGERAESSPSKVEPGTSLWSHGC